MQKIEFFEYFLYQILSTFDEDKYKNEVGYRNEDFGMLKAQKLLFFTCSLSAINYDREGSDLFDIFDNFYAMPFGHVESDVYAGSDKLKYFTLSKDGIEQIETINEIKFENHYLKFIKILKVTLLSFKKILRILFDDSNYEIVEKSHSLSSWKNYYDIALSKNKYSEFIPKEYLRRESKFVTPVLA